MSTAIATTFWEAVYPHRTIRESDGIKYADIPRDDLTEFRLIYQGQLLFSTPTPPGATGRNLRFRIRRETTGEARFLLGWMPHGPAFLLDPAAIDKDDVGLWIADQGFHTQADCRCVPPHPPGWFDPPVPLGGEV